MNIIAIKDVVRITVRGCSITIQHGRVGRIKQLPACPSNRQLIVDTALELADIYHGVCDVELTFID